MQRLLDSPGYTLKLILKKTGTKKQPNYKIIMTSGINNKQMYLVGFYSSILAHNNTNILDDKKKDKKKGIKLKYKFLYFNKFLLSFVFANNVILSKNVSRLFYQFNLTALNMDYDIKFYETYLSIFESFCKMEKNKNSKFATRILVEFDKIKKIL